MSVLKKIDLCVMFGGRSSEYEVSLVSAYNIINAVDEEKYNLYKIGVTKDGVFYLYFGDNESIKDGSWTENENNKALSVRLDGGGFFTDDGEKLPCDVVFPVMHGEYCEDGRLQGLFDICGIKYVGCGVTSSAASMNKYLTKLVAENWGIPVARYIHLKRRRLENHLGQVISDIRNAFGYPVFVKPVSAGSSVGAYKVDCEDELVPALMGAVQIGGEVLVEEYVKAKEIEVAVCGNDHPVASVCGEINPGAEFYDYDTKYKNSTASYYIPARISENESKQVREYAIRVFRALGCKGLSRVDFFVQSDGNIVFNEINTLPGFTNISMYPTLMNNMGMTTPQIIDELVRLALE